MNLFAHSNLKRRESNILEIGRWNNQLLRDQKRLRGDVHREGNYLDAPWNWMTGIGNETRTGTSRSTGGG